jgi:hypothetical protein
MARARRTARESGKTLVQETKHIVRAATNNYIPIAISAVSGN